VSADFQRKLVRFGLRAGSKGRKRGVPARLYPFGVQSDVSFHAVIAVRRRILNRIVLDVTRAVNESGEQH
jgi:hypothetical protein